MKIIIGAGGTAQEGWVATDKNLLDITNADDWEAFTAGHNATNILGEHVFEHLTPAEVKTAMRLAYLVLAEGGRLRIAVPDAWHPSTEYLESVMPGGTGAGADDHKTMFTMRTLHAFMMEAGFAYTVVQEGWDVNRMFIQRPWLIADGHVSRSSRYDRRNVGKTDPNQWYTSLIMDGVK